MKTRGKNNRYTDSVLGYLEMMMMEEEKEEVTLIRPLVAFTLTTGRGFDDEEGKA